MTPTYPIVETFHSLQGEGTWTGSSAFFIRLGGCDVQCPWCDTKQSWPAWVHPHQSVSELVKAIATPPPAFIVITGGEPLMHNLQPLTNGLSQTGIPLHLETSGAYPLTGKFDWITLSPKPYKPPHPSIYPYTHALKIIISSQEDLEWAKLQGSQVPAATLKYLQPEWFNPDSTKLVYNYILAHPEWCLSLQTHKLIGIQ